VADSVTLSAAQDVVEAARKKAQEIGVPMNSPSLTAATT
jgi:hypothetical protein